MKMVGAHARPKAGIRSASRKAQQRRRRVLFVGVMQADRGTSHRATQKCNAGAALVHLSGPRIAGDISISL
jgi:hypothetical protein